MSNNYAHWSNDFNFKYAAYYEKESSIEKFENSNSGCSCGKNKKNKESFQTNDPYENHEHDDGNETIKPNNDGNETMPPIMKGPNMFPSTEPSTEPFMNMSSTPSMTMMQSTPSMTMMPTMDSYKMTLPSSKY